ncbi:neprilysin-11-like isoform X2 [Prorops nasuta]|uniref:neprilysin-11-like isoform X2 n=1 Tax=Prorops nasuta TaxID=863751 RepID=UPI0034CF6DE3
MSTNRNIKSALIRNMSHFVIFFLMTGILIIRMGYGFVICKEEKCLEIANELTKAMNISIDPCDDFYGYVCGNWNKYHPVSDNDLYRYLDMPSILNTNMDKQKIDILTNTPGSASSKALKTARKLFSSCMDVDSLDQNEASNLLTKLKTYGDWLLVNPEPVFGVKKSWQEYLQMEYQFVSDNPFFRMNVGQHPKLSKVRLLVIRKPIMFLTGTVHVDNRIKRGVIKAYKQYVYEVASYLRRKSGKCNLHSTIDKDIHDMIKFEMNLAKVEDTRSKLLTIEEFQIMYNDNGGDHPNAQMDWLEAIQFLFKEAGVTITKTQKVKFFDFEYFMQLPQTLKVTNSRIIANYIVWAFIRYNIKYSGKQLMSIRKEFNDKIYIGGMPEIKRELTCLRHPNLDKAISLEYLKRYFIESNKNEAQKIIDHIFKIYEESLIKIDWMDSNSINVTVEKVQNIKTLVGYPDDYNSSTIDEYYKNFKLGSNYLESMINLEKFKYLVELSQLPTDISRTQWNVEPTMTDACYKAGANAMTVPAAFLQFPVFHPDLPEVLLYAFFGFTIAHEISHAFDRLGVKCDKEGNVVDIWPPHIYEIYLEKAKCFIDQFNNILVPELCSSTKSVYTNGRLTLSENIADSIALQRAYDAYKDYQRKNGGIDVRLLGFKDISSDKLFFIYYALVH